MSKAFVVLMSLLLSPHRTPGRSAPGSQARGRPTRMLQLTVPCSRSPLCRVPYQCGKRKNDSPGRHSNALPLHAQLRLLDNERELARTMAAAFTPRIACGERAGQNVRRLGLGCGYAGERPA